MGSHCFGNSPRELMFLKYLLKYILTKEIVELEDNAYFRLEWCREKVGVPKIGEEKLKGRKYETVWGETGLKLIECEMARCEIMHQK